jgi:hypothetical protein
MLFWEKGYTILCFIAFLLQVFENSHEGSMLYPFTDSPPCVDLMERLKSNIKLTKNKFLLS